MTRRLGATILSIAVIAGCGSDDTEPTSNDAGTGGGSQLDARADNSAAGADSAAGRGGGTGGGTSGDATTQDQSAPGTGGAAGAGPDGSPEAAAGSNPGTGGSGPDGSPGTDGATGGAAGHDGGDGSVGHDAADGNFTPADAADVSQPDVVVDATTVKSDAEAGPDFGWNAFLPLATGVPFEEAGTGGKTLDLVHHFDAVYSSDVTFQSTGAQFATNTHNIEIGNSTTPGPIDLTGSYSISLWVTLTDNISSFKTILSAYGNTCSAFYLQKRDENGAARFSFTLSRCDGQGGCVGGTDSCKALSGIAPVIGTRYHLVATRDGTTGIDTLYVNGASDPTVGSKQCGKTDAANDTFGWAANTFGVGHGKSGGVLTDRITGNIAGLGFVQRVLTAAEVAQLYALGAGYTP